MPLRSSKSTPMPAIKPRPCISAIDLTLVFQGKALCRHLDFTVPLGGLTVLAPQDNLCKAALFELLAGRCSPASGEFLVGGHPIDEMPVEIRQQIGLLENSDRVYEVMTLGQTAIFFGGCFSQWNNDRFHALIEELGLTRRMKISNLSHQQRILIALAVLLARNPQLLVIDDWVTGLNPAARTFIYEAIHRYRSWSSVTTLLLGRHVDLGPHYIDHLILIGESTALTLPGSDLVGPAPTAPPSAANGRILRGDNRHAQ